MSETGPFDQRAVVKSLGGFLVGGLLFYLFSRALDVRRVLALLSRADAGWLGVAFAATALALLVWAKAWDVVLETIDVPIPLSRLVPTYYAATFADYVTPFGKAGGGPLIAYILSRDRRASYEEGLASVVVADGLNLLPFFSFAGAGVLALSVRGSLPPRVRPVLYGLGGMALGVPALAFLLWRRDRAVVSAVARVSEWLSDRVGVVSLRNVEERLVEFFALVDEISDSRGRLWETLAFAYVGWVCFAAPLYFAGRALSVSISPLLVAFVVPASAMASFVPTPGGLGGVEAALVGLLVALAGLPVEVAAAVALVYRAASYWFVLLTGGTAALWLLWRQ